MSTNKQRINAVAATAVIVLAGGWFASLVPSADASDTGYAKPDNIAPASPVAKLQKTLAEQVGASQMGKHANVPSGETIKVSIDGIRSNRGKIYVALFDDAKAFNSHDYGRAVGFKELQARTGSMETNFPDLDIKAYAISIFHDENGNQSFDMLDGYPAEGYGMSRANSAYDELKFHQARVKPGSVDIRLHYLQ